MEVKIISDADDVLDVELDSLTIAEVLRVYLNEAGAKLAVWKRDHPTTNPVLHIEGDNPRELLKSAISKVEEDVDSVMDSFKKSV